MICSKCNTKNREDAKICSKCGVDLIVEVKSFWRHLFNWKYYIFPIVIGLLFGVDYSQTGTYSLSNIKLVGLIMGIVMAVQFKANFLSKLGMFFIGEFATNFLSVVVHFSFISLYGLFGNNAQELIVQKLLEQNKIYPRMPNEEVQVLKYTSDSGNSVKLHLKFINYTKNEILLDYDNRSDNFEKEKLNRELKVSCKGKGVEKIIADGLIYWLAYYDKSNYLIGQIYLNDERCKSYYKQL